MEAVNNAVENHKSAEEVAKEPGKGVRVNELHRSSQYSRGLDKQVDADIGRPVYAMRSNKINVMNIDGNQMVSGS